MPSPMPQACAFPAAAPARTYCQPAPFAQTCNSGKYFPIAHAYGHSVPRH